MDNYLSAEVLLPQGDKMVTGTVKSRKRNADGTVRGEGHSNPMLDTRVYHVEFPDRALRDCGASVRTGMEV